MTHQNQHIFGNIYAGSGKRWMLRPWKQQYNNFVNSVERLYRKKRAVRVPKTGYRQDGSAVYRKVTEYLIVRADNFGVDKIVTYGVDDD